MASRYAVPRDRSADAHAGVLRRLVKVAGGASFLVICCLPRHDLDEASRGFSASAGVNQDGTAGKAESNVSGAGGGGATALGGSAGAGSPVGAGRGGSSAGGSGGAAGAAGGAPTSGAGSLSALPSGLDDSPVIGNVTLASSEATWQVNGTMQPAYQIATPTAGMFLVKSLGMVVSLVDTADGGDGKEWINYSDSYRPNRGLPNIGNCCQGNSDIALTTTLDTESMNVGHIRLNSRSSSESWSLIWDFYRTHVTLTVNRAPKAFSFGYRGTPGGALENSDRVVWMTGESHAASDGASALALGGDVQWAYIADNRRKRSLFVMQFGADSFVDRYSVADADTAVLTLGDMALQAPLRFSFGLVDSADHAVIQARVNYVAGVTPAH